MENAYDDRVKSRPLYLPIKIKGNAAFHLFIEEGKSKSDASPDVASGLLTLFNQCDSSVKSWLNLEAEDISAISKPNQEKSSHPQSAESEALVSALSSLPLAAQIYVSGSESFMWDVHNLFISAGLLTEQISLMQPTSSIRRVFCTHCYTIMEEVTHTPVTCDGCQRPLLVRDHFSRFHGAYVGLNVNAEDENDIPEPEVLT